MNDEASPSPSVPVSPARPAGVEDLVIPVPDARLGALRIRSRTTDPAGAPLALLLPGIAGSADDFLPLFGPLADRGVTVVAVSQRGQRGSTGPAHPEPPVDAAGYELAELGRDVHRVLDALAPAGPVHLLGHSLGGLVGIEAVVQDPSRFATYTHANSGPRSSHDRTEQIAAVRRGGSAGLWEMYTGGAPVDPANPICARIISTDSAQLLGALQLLHDQADRTAELRATGVPVLVMHGSADDTWPHAWQRDMAERVGGRYAIIEGAGHDSHRDQPAATAKLLAEFWG